MVTRPCLAFLLGIDVTPIHTLSSTISTMMNRDEKVQAGILVGLLLFIFGVLGYQVVDEWGTEFPLFQSLSMIAFALPLMLMAAGSMGIAFIVAEFLTGQRGSNRPTGVQIIKYRIRPYGVWIVVGIVGVLITHNFTIFRGRLDLVLLICAFATLGIGGITFVVNYFRFRR